MENRGTNDVAAAQRKWRQQEEFWIPAQEMEEATLANVCVVKLNEQ